MSHSIKYLPIVNKANTQVCFLITFLPYFTAWLMHCLCLSHQLNHTVPQRVGFILSLQYPSITFDTYVTITANSARKSLCLCDNIPVAFSGYDLIKYLSALHHPGDFHIHKCRLFLNLVFSTTWTFSKHQSQMVQLAVPLFPVDFDAEIALYYSNFMPLVVWKQSTFSVFHENTHIIALDITMLRTIMYFSQNKGK